MKKGICAVLAILFLLSVAAPAALAADGHVHAGVLQSLKTDAGQSVPRCGVFRCSACGAVYEASVTSRDVGMPIVELSGDLSGMTKEQKVTARLSFSSEARSFETYASMKWQGDSSLRYPKKNYSVSFVTESGGKNKLEVRPEWGRQSKYCLKANWVDLSAARNIVSARLWGEIVHARCKDDPVDSLWNGGAVDGFPVLLYNNGDFMGLYTFNTPKDKWIYGMGDGKREGLMMANGYGRSCDMYEPIADVNDPAASQWDVEYCSTEDDPEGVAWLSEALNGLITCVSTLDGDALKDALGQYADVDRIIDYLVFITALRAEDNRAKNIMWATYDGTRFVPCAYDLEGSWGMNWNGTFVAESPEVYATPTDTMFTEKMVRNYGPELKARYAALRRNVLSLRNIENLFTEFVNAIPAAVYQAEQNRWPTQPGVGKNDLSQILTFARRHLRYLDSYYGVSVDEQTNGARMVKFACTNGAKAFVYPAGNLTADPVRAAFGFSTDASVAPTETGGQIVFRVQTPEGTLPRVSVTPANAYASLEGPEITGVPGCWRVAGISNFLTVRLSAEPDAAGAEGYAVGFDCPSGVRVLVYPGNDYGVSPAAAAATQSVDPDTGIPTKDGGQVNFKIVSDTPSDVFTVSASPKNYKSIKGFDTTGEPNVFRITKITGDLTVTVARDTAHTHAYSYQYAQIAGDTASHRVYCVCGQSITEPHAFVSRSENGEKYNVCTKCGCSVKTSRCDHLCHTENPVLRVVWKIICFFYKIFRTNRMCSCGEYHY